ncbi:MAG: DUF4255 domain-containing protein [Methylococcaceae bacterium]|nr:DUF4255 domain-containing protein [Methylococcaceae bacterium]
MIDKTFAFILKELDDFLKRLYPSAEAHAVMSSLTNLDGTLPLGIENKLILTLVNVERESAAPATGLARPGNAVRVAPPLNLNLFILVTAHFGANYLEALKFLSAALAFFQSNPVFSPHSGPAFPEGLDKLSLDMVSLDMQTQNYLWSNLGGKYMPSVLYKARMLNIQTGRIAERVPVASGSAVGM